MGSHFAYGAGAGMVYTQTFGRLPISTLQKGALFGLGFWAANYLGIAPSFSFRSNALNMPVRRNAMMIAAHLIWGASLSYAEEVLRKSGNEILAGNEKAPAAE